MDRIQDALCALSRALKAQAIPHMVLGGLANMIWGTARMTVDIDVSVLLSEEDVPRLLEDLAKAGFIALPADPVTFMRQTKVLPLRSPDGPRVDLILAFLPLEQTAIDRAVPVRFGVDDIPFCTAEDLIILKAVSTRNKDREDINGVIARMGGELDRAYLLPILKDLAALLERPDIGELWQMLSSPG